MAVGTPDWFARQVLAGIGAPLSSGNVSAMLDWMAAEGGHWNNSATYNPLNTTMPMPGYTKTGTQGNIGAYTSWQQGVAATVKTLLNGRYGGIISGFKGNDPGAALNAVVTSPWGTKSIGSHSSSSFAGAGSSLAQTPKTASIDTYLDASSQYGYLAAYLRDPEIGPILAKAAQEGWGPTELQAAISKTKWWQRTSASQREWEATKRLDNASARQQAHDMKVKISALASSEGVSISPARLTEMADHALGASWTDLELREAVAAEFKYDPKHAYAGVTGQAIAQLKGLANSYLVPLSDQHIGDWTRSILRGTQTAEGYANYLKEQAKSLYPYLAANLDGGMTTAQYADPYRQVASNLLGINPNSVDFTKPQWQAALTQVDEKGQRIPMTLADWQTHLMSNPSYGFDNSPVAKQQAADFASKIAQSMGALA